MRRLIAFAGVALLSVPTVATARTRNVIEGRVVHGETKRGVGHLTVTLLGARQDGTDRVEFEATTASNGRFSFPKVEVDPELTYTVETVYDGGVFVGKTIAMDDGVPRPIDLTVWDTTSNPTVISVERHHIFVLNNDDGVGAIESVTVKNAGEFAYVGRAARMGGDSGPATPTLGFALAQQAIGGRVDILSSDLNRLYATETDFGFAATVAIPPGETTTIFGYAVEGSGGRYDISRRVLYPTSQLKLFVANPFVIDSNLLNEAGDEVIEGRTYHVWQTTSPLDAGDLVPINAVAEGSSSGALTTGVTVAFGVIALLVVAMFALRRRPLAAPRVTREDVLTAIATLDLRKEAGDISSEEWEVLRAELKSKLKEPEPAP